MLPRRLREHLAGLLEWSPVDLCILAALIVLIFAASYAIAGYYYLTHREIAPYVNDAYADAVLAWHVLVGVGGWLAIALVGLLLRSRAPDSPILVYTVCLFYGIGFGIESYALGHYTSLFTGVTLIGGATIGLVLFDRRAVLVGIASYIAIIIVTTVPEQAGLLPYGPLFASAPFEGGRLSAWWLVNIGGITFVLMLVVVAVIDFIIQRWHEQEVRLAETSDQLARTNDLISRYVAAQVAEQIFAGNYGVIDRHDRRKLTLVFSDIKGFSSMADQLEPEDTSRFLNEYLSEMTAIARRYGATIDKFIGDALMVFFGAPVATEDRDHALRAVRMATAMQKRVGELSAKWIGEGLLVDQPFQIRIGINSGVASVGNFGSRDRLDYTAIGRQVNLAARLQVHCAPGEVLLSHATWSLIKDEIACEPKGEIQVRGISHPVKVYEVAIAERDQQEASSA